MDKYICIAKCPEMKDEKPCEEGDSGYIHDFYEEKGCCPCDNVPIWKAKENKTNKDLAMYILVNEDIKIGKGKLAGQVGHAVSVYFYHYYHPEEPNSLIEQYMDSHQTKIILHTTQSKLEQLEKEGWITIRDKGWTDLKPNTLTCINLGILDKNNIPKELEFIKELKLCR